MAYPVVVIGNMASTQIDALLSSGYLPAGTPINNGSIVKRGALISGQTDVYTVTVPSATPDNDDLYMVEAPVLYTDIYGGRTNYGDPRKFQNIGGLAFRMRKIHVGDKLTVTKDVVTGSPVVGEFALPTAGAYTLEASATATTALAFQITQNKYISIGQEQVEAWELIAVKA